MEKRFQRRTAITTKGANVSKPEDKYDSRKLKEATMENEMKTVEIEIEDGGHHDADQKKEKPKVKVIAKLQPYPRYALSAPSGSPKCYGDQVKRNYSIVCGGCPFEQRCAEFCDTGNALNGPRLGIETPPTERLAWDDNEPLLPGRKKNPWIGYHPKPFNATYEEQGMLRSVRCRPPMGAVFYEATARLWIFAILPLETAVEIAEQAIWYGDRLELWHNHGFKLKNMRPLPRANLQSVRIAYATEVARRILMSQGRCHALSAKFVHETWHFVFSDRKTLGVIEKRWRQDYASLVEFRSYGWEREQTNLKATESSCESSAAAHETQSA